MVSANRKGVYVTMHVSLAQRAVDIGETISSKDALKDLTFITGPLGTLSQLQ